ncbi:MAG: thioredoxin family protein [Bdellovibrionales bacterium]|nr:thioredoxin family protein [Bdellovibrionales bacterium]
MKKVEVFGTGCKKCVTTEQLIERKAKDLGTEIDLSHIHDPVAIASRGIMTTPAVMVDGKLVHKGGLPSEQDIEAWLK